MFVHLHVAGNHLLLLVLKVKQLGILHTKKIQVYMFHNVDLVIITCASFLSAAAGDKSFIDDAIFVEGYSTSFKDFAIA